MAELNQQCQGLDENIFKGFENRKYSTKNTV